MWQSVNLCREITPFLTWDFGDSQQTVNLLAEISPPFWKVCWLSPKQLTEMGVFLLANLVIVTKSASTNSGSIFACRFNDCQPNLPADLFPLQLLYQKACFNAILYFSPFKYMFTVPNAKSVLFTQISNYYLVCCNKWKFPSKHWKCCD